MLWDITYRTTGLSSRPHSVEPTSDGGFLVCGSEETSPGINAMLLVRIGTGSTGVDDKNIVTEFKLHQNYPNPFNPSTTIEFVVPSGVEGLITLKVFDILGNQAATLVNEVKETGSYEVEFNGNSLPSGIYFYKLTAGSFTETKKCILMK